MNTALQNALNHFNCLEQEYNALSQQLDQELDAANRLKIQRKIETKEGELNDAETKIKTLEKELADQNRSNLLDILNAINITVWQQVYRAVKPQNYTGMMPETLEDALIALEEMRSDRFDYSPLFNFVAYFLITNKTSTPILVRLQNWLDHELNNIGLAYSRVEADTKILIQEQNSITTGSPHLFFWVDFRNGDDRYDLEVYLVPNAEEYDAKSGCGIMVDFDQLQSFSQERNGFHKHEVQDVLMDCLQEIADRIDEMQDLTIHAFLPLNQFNDLAIDQFPIDQTPDSESTGSRYQVIFRSITRLTQYTQSNGNWKKRWETVGKICGDEICGDGISYFIPYSNQAVDRLSPKQLARTFDQNPTKTGLLLVEPPEVFSEKESSAFTAILKAGIPIALWPRQSCPELQETWTEIYEGLFQSNLKDLPKLIQQKRQEAYDCEEDENHWGKHIGLLWEDPKLIPPLYAQTSKQQRFRSL